jgi:hypothetical protein
MARWFPFENFSRYGWNDEPVVLCHLGKIFTVSEGRSAWWGSPSLRYPGIKAFWPDLAAAKNEVERRRTQGSRWHIREIPVLVISGQENAVIIGEINADEPLWKFLPPRARLLTLEQSGRCFAPRRPDSVIRIVCESGLVQVAERPFYIYRSISHGGKNVPLWWGMQLLDDGTVDRTTRLARRISKSLASPRRTPHHQAQVTR